MFRKVDGTFLVKKDNQDVLLKATLNSRFDTNKDAQQFLESCIGSEYKVENIEVKPVKRYPAPPFTTSTLQQEASRKMGFGVNRTMSAAQKLYEEGHITYMRTDSTSLSVGALQSMADEINHLFGDNRINGNNSKSS